MHIIKTKNKNELSKKAFEIIKNEIIKKPALVLGLATGKTPEKLYDFLIKECKNKKISFSKVKFFNLDEYYPIRSKNKKSFSYYLYKTFLNKIDAKPSNIHFLSGEGDVKKQCREYEKKIKNNKIDILILGIGKNSHIAFNEPNSSLNSKTRLVLLSDSTRKANKIKFTHAITLGIKNILSAKKILLLASGKSKAKALKSMLKGKVNKTCPASFLKKHKQLILIIDKNAGSLI